MSSRKNSLAGSTSAKPQSRGIFVGRSLASFMTVVLILNVAFALITPSIQVSREAARRNECADNLRHVCTASWEFYGMNRESAPISLGAGRASVHAFLLDYMEGVNTDMLDDPAIGTNFSGRMVDNWDRLSRSQQDSLSSIESSPVPHVVRASRRDLAAAVADR